MFLYTSKKSKLCAPYNQLSKWVHVSRTSCNFSNLIQQLSMWVYVGPTSCDLFNLMRELGSLVHIRSKHCNNVSLYALNPYHRKLHTHLIHHSAWIIYYIIIPFLNLANKIFHWFHKYGKYQTNHFSFYTIILFSSVFTAKNKSWYAGYPLHEGQAATLLRGFSYTQI